jgi:hypothetical protein
LPILKRGKRSRVAALDCEELLQLAKLFSLAELRGELIEKMNLGCNSETGKGQAFSAPLDVTPGEQPASPFTWRTMDAGACPAGGGTRVPANNQTLRPNKGRGYTERGGTHPVVKCVSKPAPLAVLSSLTTK